MVITMYEQGELELQHILVGITGKFMFGSFIIGNKTNSRCWYFCSSHKIVYSGMCRLS